jgi:hypothetical protein
LRGKLVDDFSTRTASTGRTINFDQIEDYKYVYVCGVGDGPNSGLAKKNFHLPLRFEEGRSVSKTTFNGYVVTARNAVEMPIPALPDGWKGLGHEATSHKNFQFAVEYFGYPEQRGIR